MIKQTSENLKSENKEITQKQKYYIEALILKNSCLIFETEKTKYYQGNRLMFSVYEDDYKFLIDIINIKTFKIEKLFGDWVEGERKEIIRHTLNVLDEAYQLTKTQMRFKED